MGVFRLATTHDLHPIHAYLHQRMDRPYGTWPRQRVLEHLRWYVESQLCAVRLAHGIETVIMGRPVVSVERGYNEPYHVEYTGRTLWVECCVSDAGMLPAWKYAMDYFTLLGVRISEVAWCRYGKPLSQVYRADSKRLEKLLR